MKSVDECQLDKLIFNKISKERFLKIIRVKPEKLEVELLEMLNIAYDQCSSCNVEVALYLIFVYELFSEMYLNLLNNLILCDWHEQHENIAMILQRIKSPQSVDYLYIAASKKYSYLEYDDNFALAVKCIWALGEINTDEAMKKLEILQMSENDIIKKNAIKQLQRISCDN